MLVFCVFFFCLSIYSQEVLLLFFCLILNILVVLRDENDGRREREREEEEEERKEGFATMLLCRLLSGGCSRLGQVMS